LKGMGRFWALLLMDGPWGVGPISRGVTGEFDLSEVTRTQPPKQVCGSAVKDVIASTGS
jgi:hypothetical protein